MMLKTAHLIARSFNFFQPHGGHIDCGTAA